MFASLSFGSCGKHPQSGIIGNNINFRTFPIYQITILCPVIEVICYNLIKYPLCNR